MELTQGVRRLGWPAIVACLLAVSGCAALVGAWWVNHQLLLTRQSISILQRTQQFSPVVAPVTVDPLPLAPKDALYLEDLKAILALAKKFNITLGAIEYKTERSDKLPLTLRTIELKVKEDYAKVKGFLSQVLADFPFASLQEIRVERTDGLNAQGVLLIRLLLVYKTPADDVTTTTTPSGVK